MNEIILTPRERSRISLEAEVITPDNFAGKSLDDIENMVIYRGNRSVRLKEHFEVSGTPCDNAEELRIIIDGDASRTKRIGEKMRGGEIVIRGNVDMHVGAEMKGGKITVEGSADNYAGREMSGGILHIKGNALHYAGGTARGKKRGMAGGTLLIDGSAGDHVGNFMYKGIIKVEGNVGQCAGTHMRGGAIIIGGNAFSRIGSEMAKGTILVKGKVHLTTASLGYGSIGRRVRDPEVDGTMVRGEFYELRGDMGYEPKCGSGIIYASVEHNEHILPGGADMPPKRNMLPYLKMYHSEIRGRC
ncbi:MAG: formylmethanofuran dehydrogenase subunit C [Methanocellales archaeon]|nr:formylmethanofuran dehydrogenase subunit C [Methanocellales archaeon]